MAHLPQLTVNNKLLVKNYKEENQVAAVYYVIFL